MKDTHVLCAVGILALVAITAVFVGYATDTLPKHTQRVITTVPPATPDTTQAATDTAQKKKNCACCKARTTAFQEKMDLYVKRKKAAAQKIAAK